MEYQQGSNPSAIIITGCKSLKYGNIHQKEPVRFCDTCRTDLYHYNIVESINRFRLAGSGLYKAFAIADLHDADHFLLAIFSTIRIFQ